MKGEMKDVGLQLKEPESDFCITEEEFFLSNSRMIELMQAVFSKKASFRFRAKGFSMAPFIYDNDVVTISPVLYAPIKLGKPVAYVYLNQKKLAVHRIIKIIGNDCLIKGDNCPLPGCLVPKEDILGCVTNIERKNKNTHFSLGPERVVIAFLSRIGLLPLWQIIPESLRKMIKCRIFS